MNKKHSIDTLLKFLYIFYAIFLLSILKGGFDFGAISGNNKIFNFINSIQINIGEDPGTYIFYVLFLSFIFLGMKSDLESIIIYEDEQRKAKLRNKLTPYKIFILVSAAFSIYMSIYSKKMNLVLSGIILTCISILIYYGKNAYFTSYIYNRKLQWMESTSHENISSEKHLIDTKYWRNKIWFNGIEKVPFKYRRKELFLSIVNLIVDGALIIAGSSLLFKIIWGYFFLYNLLSIIECIFGLYTSISGVVERSRRNNIPYYNIILTDYKNKREVNLRVEENYGFEEMDNLTAIHGVFTKRLISINLIPNRINNKGSILFSIVIISLLLYSLFSMNKDITLNNQDDEPILLDGYDSYMEEQKQQNLISRLSKNENEYEKIINVNKTDDFNDVTIVIDKLYLGKKGSKLEFKIINNSDKGLVLNASYNTHIYSKNDGENSNILLPNQEYNCEMDLFKGYNKGKSTNLEVDLEYTLSEHIIFDNEYMDYTYYYYYQLNVIDNHCLVSIDLQNNEAKINFEQYDQFYNKSEEIVKFKEK